MNQHTTEWTRQLEKSRIERLSPDILEDIAMLVETADTQGDYHLYNGEGSMWQDDVNATLQHLATEIRGMKR